MNLKFLMVKQILNQIVYGVQSEEWKHFLN